MRVMNKNNNIWESQMHVKKRDGSFQEVKFDKILTRVKKMGIQANVSIALLVTTTVCTIG